MKKYYWKIADGRIWSSADNGFVDTVPEGETLIPLMDSGAPANFDYLMETIKFYKAGPGPEYILKNDGWYKIRFTKKEFLLLCGLAKVAALNAGAKENPMLAAIHDILMASEFIDVTDQDTIQLVGLLASESGGNILSTADSGRILGGVKNESI